jgi:predicted O-methyltransferase YrrM
MSYTPQQIWDTYRKDPNQDMWPYSEFLRMNAHGNILEIGVRGGVSTAAFLLGVEKNGGHVFSVDKTDACRSLFNHPQWTFIHANSQDVEKVSLTMSLAKAPSINWTTEGEWNLEIIFIDGAHYRSGVRADLHNYGPRVKHGGLILVHDIFGTKNPSPQQIAEDWPTEAVGEEYHAFANELGWPTFDLPGQFGMGVIVRV